MFLVNKTCSIRASVDSLCRDGMARVISHVIRVQTAFYLGENACLQNTQQQPMDSSLAIHKTRPFPTWLQFCTQESAHTRFHEFRVIIFVIFLSSSVNAITLSEPAEASPNVSKVDGGVHGHQAITSRIYMSTVVDRGPARDHIPNDAICMHVCNLKGALSSGRPCVYTCVRMCNKLRVYTRARTGKESTQNIFNWALPQN